MPKSLIEREMPGARGTTPQPIGGAAQERVTRPLWAGTLAATLALASSPAHAGWRDHLTFTLGARARAEGVDYFAPPEGRAPTGAERYAFVGLQVRGGVRLTFSEVQVVLEAQGTGIIGLPKDASLPPPFGNLGPGALYFAHTPEQNQGAVFLKQGHITWARSGFTATLGRFELASGLEVVPTDPTLAWLKRSRLGERLVGPFAYTHVSRSFDGLRLAYDRPAWNLSGFATHPTHGGFEIDANPDLGAVDLLGLALTSKGLGGGRPGDLGVFYFHYEDRRDETTKVDNRPPPLRRADREPIRTETLGAHAIVTAQMGAGTIDALAWGALETGRWGVQDHSGWAWAAEAGYQLPRAPGSPWLRAGWNRASGDRDPLDERHDTFFQVLPTARIYAQFPFYNLMNGEDAFLQLVVKPHPRLLVRGDFHWLGLTRSEDLWYAGGGATNEQVFGYSGLPSGGTRSLARVAEASATLKLSDRLSSYAYFGWAFGRGAVQATFSGTGARYGYVELTYRR
jgi:hypothetical protein